MLENMKNKIKNTHNISFHLVDFINSHNHWNWNNKNIKAINFQGITDFFSS